MPAGVASLFTNFVPSNESLLHICRTFENELSLALQYPVSNSLQVFPTFVHRLPDGSERGRYLALDLGGTNFRILLITLNGKHESNVANKIFTISQALMHGSGVMLFDYIARCLHDFCRDCQLLDERISLGFTFSFPCKQVGLKKAYLTSWTKGFCCADTVNQDVGAMLQNALTQFARLKIDVAAIVNDTTGTLTSCAYMDHRCRVGVIIGTGVNLCYLESNPAMLNDPPMIINTELGALGSRNGSLDFIRTHWDDRLDASSINPGQQQFEKMISGMYLGEIVRTIALDCIHMNLLLSGSTSAASIFSKPNSFPSSHVSRVELDESGSSYVNTRAVLTDMGIVEVSREDCARLLWICSAVSQRSAYLVSAAIATILHRLDHSHTVVVGVDGSVFRHHPHYQAMMQEKIAELLASLSCDHSDGTTTTGRTKKRTNNMQASFQLMLSEDGSGRGAALVAAVSSISKSAKICEHCSKPDCYSLDNRRQCILVKQ